MEFRHLQTFVAIAETLNFCKAATRLHVTQPALSRQIRDLEDELGQKLFDRLHNGVSLTDAGRELLSGAKPILAEQEDLLARMRQRRNRQPLRIAHFGTLSAQYLSTFLRRLKKRFPEVPLQAEEYIPGEALAAVRQGKLDAGFIGPVELSSIRGLETKVVWVAPHLVLIAADHRLAKKRSVKLTDLREEQWGIWNEATFPGFGRVCTLACRAAGFRPKIASAVDDLASLFIHVADDKYVSYAPPIARQLPHPGVIFMPTDPPGAITVAVRLVWRKNSPHVRAIEWLAKAMAATLPEEMRGSDDASRS